MSNDTCPNDICNSTTDGNGPRNEYSVALLLLQYLQLYYTPLLVTIGSIGNTLSVYVFFGTKLRKLSSSYYLAALAFSDTGFLVAQFVSWLNLVHIPLFNQSGFCEITVYSSNVCSFLSVWLVVLFTVERFIAVRYPLHRPAVCTVTRAKLFIGCLTAIALPLYSPYFIIATPQFITHVENNQTIVLKVCTLMPKWMDLATTLNHVDFFLTLVLPFCTIVTLNSLICRTVRQLARVRRSMTLTARKRHQSRQHSRRSCDTRASRHAGRSTAVSSQTKVTQMLLVVSTVFICLNLPSYVLRIMVYVNKKVEAADDEYDTLTIVLQHYSSILFATNFGINFFLYCISGQNFRKALCSLFYPKRTKRRAEQTQATVLSELSRGLPQASRRHGSSVETHQILIANETASHPDRDFQHFNGCNKGRVSR